jgi:hypothetical protein
MIDRWIQQPHLTFDPCTHTYRWNGIKKRNVTSGVLGRVAVQNDKGDYVPIADSRWCKDEVARDFGVKLHEAAFKTLLGKSVEVPEGMKPWFNQFDRWRKDYDYLVPMHDKNNTPILEYPLYSQKFDFAGMVDAVFESLPGAICGRMLFIVDWKTSTTELEHWRYQTAAYEQLVREVFEIGRDVRITRMAVKFEEDQYRPYLRYKKPEDWIKFQSCLNLAA